MVAALTRPIPKFHQNSGDHCSVGSRGAAKMTVATAPMRNRAKQQGKDFYITQTSPSHLQGAQGAATGINPGRQGCAGGICLLPSCCYFLQAGTANPPPCDSSTGIGTWFWQLQAWQDRGPGRPWNTDGERTQKEKELKCWCFVVWIQRSPQQDVGSAAQVRRALHSFFSPFPVFLDEPQERLESPPSLGYDFKGY